MILQPWEGYQYRHAVDLDSGLAPTSTAEKGILERGALMCDPVQNRR
jgi:hypothetical protein